MPINSHFFKKPNQPNQFFYIYCLGTKLCTQLNTKEKFLAFFWLGWLGISIKLVLLGKIDLTKNLTKT